MADSAGDSDGIGEVTTVGDASLVGDGEGWAAGWQAASETAQTITKRSKKEVLRDIADLSILLTVRHNASMKAWKSPIRILVIYLTVLALWATFNWGKVDPLFWLQQALRFALLWTPGWLMYQGFLRTKLIRATRWEHRLITCLILYLLFDPMFPLWVFGLLSVVTEGLQRFLRLPTGPIANPAAFAALLMSFLGHFPTWWGANFGPRLEIIPGGMSMVMFLTVPVAGYVAHKYKKLAIIAPAVVMFAITYLGLLRLNPLGLLLEGTFAFFLLVMAVEPKTSPAVQNQQLVYGGAVGLAVGLFMAAAFEGFWIEPYLAGLVLCNILFNLYKNKMFLRTRFLRPKAVVQPQPISQTPVVTPPQTPNT